MRSEFTLDNIVLWDLSCPKCGEMVLGGVATSKCGERIEIDIKLPSNLYLYMKASIENVTSLLDEAHICSHI